MSASVPPPAVSEPARLFTRGRLVRRRFRRNRLAMAGLIGLGLMVLVAVAVPPLWPWEATDVDPRAFLSPPSLEHPWGTSQAGRDVLALTASGLGKSLQIGVLVAMLATALASLVGASAAYLGGWYERSMLWLIDLLLVIPSFFLIAIITRSASYSTGSWWLLALLLAAFAWPLSARVVRSATLSLREREYVLAARYLGASPLRIIIMHLLPNASSLLIIDATLGVGYAILSETGLSYFGFGVQPPEVSLGTLISRGSNLMIGYPWVFIAPAATLVVLVLCVNAIGDGLRDALDPGSTQAGAR